MMKCRMVIGESATMASEAACLGIPAIFISNTGRGYTTEQDKKYGLIKHYRLNQWEEIGVRHVGNDKAIGRGFGLPRKAGR